MSGRLAEQARETRLSTSTVLRAIPVSKDDLGRTSLADKYDLTKDRIFVSGAQAVVRMLLLQREVDRRAGHRTAGFVSGYRGSPLGRLDSHLVSATPAAGRRRHQVRVRPQRGPRRPPPAGARSRPRCAAKGRYDGVFSLWYGKGPGVDRSLDALRHANLAGTSPLGGVLALMGDDHMAESSSTAHQSEFVFADLMMPVLAPANVQEIVDYGLMGLAMSRFTRRLDRPQAGQGHGRVDGLDRGVDRALRLHPSDRFRDAARWPVDPRARCHSRPG